MNTIYIYNDATVEGRLAAYILNAYREPETPLYALPLNHTNCSETAILDYIKVAFNVKTMDDALLAQLDLVFLGIEPPRRLPKTFSTIKFVSHYLEGKKITDLSTVTTKIGEVQPITRSAFIYAWGVVSTEQTPPYLYDLDAYYSKETTPNVKRGKALAQLLSFVRKPEDFKETLDKVRQTRGQYILMQGLPIIKVLDMVSDVLFEEARTDTVFNQLSLIVNSPKVFNEFIRDRLRGSSDCALLLYQDVKGKRMWTFQHDDIKLLESISECFCGSVHNNVVGWVTDVDITTHAIDSIWREYGDL